MITKGLTRDFDAINQPKGTSPYIYNGNLTDEFGAITNERSTEVFSTLPDKYVIIGTINLNNNQKVIFCGGVANFVSRIGIENPDGTVDWLNATDATPF